MNKSQLIFRMVLLIGVLAVPIRPAAATTMDEAVGDVVKKICTYLNRKGETQIAIGQFVGPPQLAATSGPGIAKQFHDHFGRNDISVVTRANIGLKGEYALAKSSTGEIGLKISGSLVDPFGDVLSDFTFDASTDQPGHVQKVVDRHEDVVQLLGITTELHPEDSDADRNHDLEAKIRKPTLHIAGTICAASAVSPYQIEILSHGRPISPKLDNGLGFVHLARGDNYSIRLHNNSDYDAAVRISIDGLNVFTFSDLRKPNGQPKYAFYIVPAHKVVELKGWHKTNAVVSSFLVTGYADSAAASINHQHDIGTISATFSAAWAKNGKPPHDEDFTAKGGRNATGFGPPVTQVVQEVEREVGRLRASISLRYSK